MEQPQSPAAEQVQPPSPAVAVDSSPDQGELEAPPPDTDADLAPGTDGQAVENGADAGAQAGEKAQAQPQDDNTDPAPDEPASTTDSQKLPAIALAPGVIPTTQAYGELQVAFDHYNEHLFDGKLPQCLITMQREARSYGYFASQRFVNQHDHSLADEIALNPSYFGVVTLLAILQTLVHEMVHAWQFHFGQPGRRGYHNKQWAEKMQEIGLMPSDTGKPGGKMLGEKMADYPIPDGQFLKATKLLLDSGFGVSWWDRFHPVMLPSNEPAQPVNGMAQMGLEPESQMDADDAPDEAADDAAPSGPALFIDEEEKDGEADQDQAGPTGESAQPLRVTPVSISQEAAPAQGKEKQEAKPTITQADLDEHTQKVKATLGSHANAATALPATNNMTSMLLAPVKPKTRSGSRTKFCCPVCNANAWGRDSLLLLCGDAGCNQALMTATA